MTVESVRRRDRLWNLLPEFQRRKDAEAGYPLRGLLGSIGTEFARVEGDIEESWNDEFIETCRPWVIPYIAELLGVEPIHEVDGTARADIGLTMSFRKRQGTLPMLEELAETVTGWETVVAEMYKRLSWTQNLNHLDSGRTTCDLTSPGTMQLLGTPFDPHEYTVDVRPPSSAVGRPNISNIAFYVHRLVEDRFPRVSPRAATSAAGEWRFFLHPAGVDAALFHRVEDDDDRDRRVDENETHSAIRTGWFAKHLQERPGVSSRVIELSSGPLVLTGDDRTAAAAFPTIRCADLSTWQQPPPGTLYIDVTLGRIACAPADRLGDLGGDFAASFSSGAAGAIGARGRQRSSSKAYELLEKALDDPVPSPDDADPEDWQRLTVGRDGAHATIGAALAAWSGDKTVIRILDSGTYEEDVGFVARTGSHLVIQAAEGERPTLIGNIRLLGGASQPPLDDRMRLTLDGIHISGCVRVTAGAAVDKIAIAHCSVWPMTESESGAEPSADRGIQVLGAVNLLIVANSSVGGIETTSATDQLTVADSVIDGHGAAAIAGEGGVRSGPATTLDRSTLFGSLFVRELHASDCIIIGPVVVRRTQIGCVRYSFLPTIGDDATGNRTPRRYRCQPDLAIDEESEAVGNALDGKSSRTVQRAVSPQFASRSPNAPAYATLIADAPPEIRRGAEAGLEMGAWNFLQDPRRIDNLRRRLADYLPYGLTPGIVYAN